MNLRKDHYRLHCASSTLRSKKSRVAPLREPSWAASPSGGGLYAESGLQSCQGSGACRRPAVPVQWLLLKELRWTLRVLEPSPCWDVDNCVLFWIHFESQESRESSESKDEIQHCTVDHLARGSMKNAANCASECELQDT